MTIKWNELSLTLYEQLSHLSATHSLHFTKCDKHWHTWPFPLTHSNGMKVENQYLGVF
jgi:hypothetical protein